MSIAGSRGTTVGMRRWYAKIPRCKHCKKNKLTQHKNRDLSICSSCFKKLTGKKMSELESMLWKHMKPIAGHKDYWTIRTNRIKQYLNAFIDTPVEITDGEWWFKGCFIQKQSHPELLPFVVFKDDESQTHIGVFTTFEEAKSGCIINKQYHSGIESFLWQVQK